jgi:hypothetical protein
MNSTDIRLWSAVAVTTAMLLSGAANSNCDCDFDTDDADGPDFLDKIIECEEQQSSGNQSQESSRTNSSAAATKLYGDGSLTTSGIIERPVAAAGTLSHYADKSFVARQPYSLRPDAKFEESVTIAIQKLHLEMAHYCARGWDIERQWTEANSQQQGDFFLHYQFRCTAA